MMSSQSSWLQQKQELSVLTKVLRYDFGEAEEE